MSSITLNQADKTQQSSQTSNSSDADLGKLFGILLDARWSIIAVTFIFSVLGVCYALLTTPVYKADALIQVEQKSGSMSALVGDMGDMFSSESSATTEVEIIKSRMVLSQTVEKFNLTTLAAPKYLPVIGKGLARMSGQQNDITISRFEIPSYASPAFSLIIDASSKGAYTLYDGDERKVLSGVVGELAQNNDYRLFVQALVGKNTDEFSIAKQSKLDAIQWLQQNLLVSERGKQTGILQLTFSGEDKVLIEDILNDVSQNYFLQNVQRNSAEAEKILAFLQGHLPNIKTELTAAEDTLNRFRQNNESIDLGLEAASTLKVMVALESQLNELTFKESEISQRFTKDHPAYKSLLDKREVLLAKQHKLNAQVQKLPKTQRDVLRMKRDVEVNQQIYIQLLNKVYSKAVKPKKSLIVVLVTLLGGMLAVAVVLVRAALHKGIENPDEVEALGLPVYASIPMSDWQAEMDVKFKHNKRKKNFALHETLLAESNPADLSIEALRGLRTSMHFAMMEAKNNVVMISGPAPGIGKSFVSVNFAAVIAKTGQKVLLVDGDMRKGYLQRHFNLEWDHGLSEMPNPSELLMHPRFADFIIWASSEYDLVLIDTPPVLAVTDPSIVGALAGTTLMVGRFGQNTVKEIEVARHRFEMAGIEVKGFILNAVEKKASASYGDGYYNYSYESDKF
ncbi:Wzz/FepE/Etk N-terminal domain-containing protein [Moritella viscosa]